MRFFWLILIALNFGFPTKVASETLTVEAVQNLVLRPYEVGESIGEGAWELNQPDGRLAGYVFESEPRAPLPGFSGAPINLLVSITLEGKLINVDLVSHNEPIFVSGLGEAAFHKFVEQYKGLSINDTLIVGIPYGKSDGSGSHKYLKGVTKATASVRIAHESILAAAFAIAREKMGGVGSGAPSRPNLELEETLTWNDLVEQGIAHHLLITNKEVDEAFKDTIWEDDDDIAKESPDEAYLDLWLVNIGAPSVAKAILSDYSYKELRQFQEISAHDEPILVIENGRHGLISENFVRNTSPELVSAKQDGLPIALRDSDLDVELKDNISNEFAMILRTDRRIGFNPTRDWDLLITALRKHGSFQAQTGSVEFKLTSKADERFYIVDKPPVRLAPWQEAILQRKWDLIILGIAALTLFSVLLIKQSWFAALKSYTLLRLTLLAGTIGFIGWYGQGQLSMATALGFIRSIYEGQSLSFLLYDPFSLLIWGIVIVSFFIWGRGLFCGWLCPFGAMQEFANHLGRLLGLKQIDLPEKWDSILSKLKYVILAVMIGCIFFAPAMNDKLIEIEPFKTAVTTFFIREWYYVAYAIGLLLLSMVLFKGFCRYLCPLGAFMAIGGLFRQKDWIKRRVECGSPCQLCKVKCNYGAIKPTGKIKYSECFQCLDCVTIYNDDETCVPLVLAAKGKKL